MAKYIAFVLLVFAVGFVVFKGGDDKTLKTASLPAERLDRDLLVETVSHGEPFQLDDHLVTGTWTVVEFTADW